MKARKIYTVAALCMLIALYIAIFCFSAEDGESSSDLSSRVTKMILDIYYRITAGGVGGGGTGAMVQEDTAMFDYVEGIVRKLAHFTEYMCVGFLSYSLVALWYSHVWKGRFFVLCQLFLSAGLDEFHQYFVPGRHASLKDVLIDTAGGITGMLIIAICGCIRKKVRRIIGSTF